MLDLTPRPVWHDDAGEPRRLVTYRELNRDERRADPAFQAIASRAGRAVVSTTSKLAIFVPAMLIPFGGNLVHSFLLPAWPVWLVYAGMVVPTLPLSWFLAGQNLQRSAGRLADTLLADGLCPACLYNLADQPTDDQLARCPECGSIWRAARIVRRHQFETMPESETAAVRRWWRRTGSFDSSGPTRICDDTGKERPVVHSRLAMPIANATGARRRTLLDARREIRGRGRAKRVAVALVPLVLLLPLLTISLALGGPPTAPRLLGLGAFAAFLLLVVLAGVGMGSVGIRSEHIREAMLRRRLCPSCAGDLPEPHDMGGVCNCPECGAVWRSMPGPEPEASSDA